MTAGEDVVLAVTVDLMAVLEPLGMRQAVPHGHRGEGSQLSVAESLEMLVTCRFFGGAGWSENF